MAQAAWEWSAAPQHRGGVRSAHNALVCCCRRTIDTVGFVRPDDMRGVDSYRHAMGLLHISPCSRCTVPPGTGGRVDDDRVVTPTDFIRRAGRYRRPPPTEYRRRRRHRGDAPQSRELVVVMFACWYRGAPLQPALTVAGVNYQLTDSGNASRGRPLHGGYGGGRPVSGARRHRAAVGGGHQPVATAPDVADDLGTLALLIYTSGTTGSPKGDARSLQPAGDGRHDRRAGVDAGRPIALILPLFTSTASSSA